MQTEYSIFLVYKLRSYVKELGTYNLLLLLILLAS
jgi:hypothetical protein